MRECILKVKDRDGSAPLKWRRPVRTALVGFGRLKS